MSVYPILASESLKLIKIFQYESRCEYSSSEFKLNFTREVALIVEENPDDI